MDKDDLRKAQLASRTAFLKKEAQRQQKTANAVLDERLREVEQGIVPESVTEADFLLKRSLEVETAGDLLRVARRREELAGEYTTERERELEAERFSRRNAVDTVLEENLREAMGTTAALEGSSAFVPMQREDVEKRVDQHDYVKEKTFEELQDERVRTLQNRREKLQEQRRSLPIYQVRGELMQMIRDNQVVIIVGETGSGKTTQLLQYMYEDGMHLGTAASSSAGAKETTDGGADVGNTPVDGEVEELRLVCTQPRRIAATSVAERVAEEVGSRCGSVVGYKVRFDDKTGPLTRIMYVTDGMMLKEFTSDPDMSSVAAIMVDEAHERSLNTDVLLGLLRDVVRRNNRIKVIVASATINADKFSRFFDGAPVFTVSGRTFPVETFYSDEPVADYVTESAQTALGLHVSKPLPGDILIFLPGQDAIEACAEALQKYAEEGKGQLRPLLILPIYSSLPPKEQARIYERTPPGTRKVVIATNIAETSITIDGIVYVVDCGLCKQDFYNPQAMVEELRIVPTSQASATQRAGRAGRTQPGECYRLFTAYTFKNELPRETIPEIMRCSMSAVVLQLKALGIHNLLQFDFIDAPSTASLERALDHLFLLGAMKADGRLTTSGRRMAEFPMDPSLSKCLIRACALGCGRHMAMATAMLTLDSIFLNTRDAKEKQLIKSAKEELFGFGNGDVVGYARIMEDWLRAGPRAAEFCKSHCINAKSMLRARDVLDQILKIYDRVGLDVDSGEKKASEAPASVDGSAVAASRLIETEALTKALLSGFFFNVSRLEPDKWSYLIIRPMDSGSGADGAPKGGAGNSGDDAGQELEEVPVAEIHPSSFLFSAGMQKKARGPGVDDAALERVPLVLRSRPGLIVFTQLRRTTKRFMTHVTAINDPEWVLQSAPVNYFQKQELETGLRKRPRE